MAEFDFLKNALDVGMAFTQLTRQRAEALVTEFVRNGEVTREQAAIQVEELIERSRKNTELILGLVRKEIEDRVNDLATRDDLNQLAARMGVKLPRASGARSATAAKKKAGATKAAAAGKAGAAGRKKRAAKRSVAAKKSGSTRKTSAAKKAVGIKKARATRTVKVAKATVARKSAGAKKAVRKKAATARRSASARTTAAPTSGGA